MCNPAEPFGRVLPLSPGRRLWYDARSLPAQGNNRSMADRIGPLATINREPGQARKGAAAAVDSGAGVWLVRAATLSPPCDTLCSDILGTSQDNTFSNTEGGATA